MISQIDIGNANPWGKRRSATNWTLAATPPSGGWGAFNRGYTGHEHLDAFGIINMNGRVYDPSTAMFFSPDPFIQSGGEWKNYNRYSYCMNNPTRFTDPSGYKRCYIDMPVFNDYASSWMSAGSGGGGKNSPLRYWSDHQGPITYNEENKRFEYPSGEEASSNEAMKYQEINVPATLAFGFQIAIKRGWAGNYEDFLSLYNQRTARNSYNGTFSLHLFESFYVVGGAGSKVAGSIDMILRKGLGGDEEAKILTNLQYGVNGIISTVLTGKSLLIRGLANDFIAGGNVAKITTAAAQLNKIAKPFKVAGSVLGVYSAYQHGEKVYNAYNNKDWGCVAINGGKLALDILFMTSKCVNPVFLGASVAYGVVDYMTNDY